MITVKVQYQVQGDYVQTNKEMIQRFLNDFSHLDNSRFLYSIFQTEDEKTFIHLSQYKDKEIQEKILNNPNFVKFQQQRDLHLLAEPDIQILHYIGASKNIL